MGSWHAHGALVAARRECFGSLPGMFWLFAIGELVGYKPSKILAASSWVSGKNGQCRDTIDNEYTIGFVRSFSLHFGRFLFARVGSGFKTKHV
jgi:hypothetical protein